MDELGRIGVIRVNASNPRRRQEHILGLVLAKECFDRPLVDEIELRMAAREEIGMPAGGKPAHQRRAGQTAVARHINLRVLIHDNRKPQTRAA